MRSGHLRLATRSNAADNLAGAYADLVSVYQSNFQIAACGRNISHVRFLRLADCVTAETITAVFATHGLFHDFRTVFRALLDLGLSRFERVIADEQIVAIFAEKLHWNCNGVVRQELRTADRSAK